MEAALVIGIILVVLRQSNQRVGLQHNAIGEGCVRFREREHRAVAVGARNDEPPVSSRAGDCQR